MQIIFSDRDILIINKPSGVLSIADGYNKTIPYLRTILEPEFGRLWIVHRLDKETSGVMVLARSAASHKFLNDQFTKHSILKEYFALVFGCCPEHFSNNSHLLVNGDRLHRTVINEEKGKPAFTEFSRIESFCGETSLVSALPKTGFSHQIRAHLLHSGFPILGDSLYSAPESRKLSEILKVSRVALHARKIRFIHPSSLAELSFEASLPDDFLEFSERCKRREHQPG